MHRLKDLLTDPPGVTPTPGKFVCPDCFVDDALKDVVRHNAKSKTCSYCTRRSTKPVAAPLDEVAEHILSCLEARYEDAANGVGWEGGYVGAETSDTWDLVESEVEFGNGASEDLLSDLENALPAQNWGRIDPYGPLERDVMKWSWRDFSETVKHIRRFFFQDHLTPADSRSETVSPAALLASVAKGCESYGLVKMLKPGQRLFRCRS
jgi:HEPN/RES N-terminal domain 1